MMAKPIRALEFHNPMIQSLRLPITHPYSQWRKLQANDKITASFQTKYAPQPLSIKRCKQHKQTLENC